MALTDWNNVFTQRDEDEDQFAFDLNMTSQTPLSTTLGVGSYSATLASPTTVTTGYTYSNVTGAVSAATTGGYLSTTGSGQLNWGNITSLNNTYTITASDAYANAWGVNGKTLKVNGDADITGDIKVGGVSLTERLDKIEERLGILRINEQLEEKWEKLKALGEEYRKLEKEIIDGEKVWDILKK